MIHCTKTIEFDAAHRLIGHNAGCQMVHGHRYNVEITFSGTKTDEMGMIVDFKIIKTRLKKWLDDNWDHNIILHIDDKSLGDMVDEYTGQKSYYLPYNPTAENIALYLYTNIVPKIFGDLPLLVKCCTSIKISETPTSFAAVTSSSI